MTIFKYKRDGKLYTIHHELQPICGRKIACPYAWDGKRFEIKGAAKLRDMIPVGTR